MAALVLWRGDPLEVISYPDRLFIAGREIACESHKTSDRNRYMNRGDWPNGYPDSNR